MPHFAFICGGVACLAKHVAHHISGAKKRCCHVEAYWKRKMHYQMWLFPTNESLSNFGEFVSNVVTR